MSTPDQIPDNGPTEVVRVRITRPRWQTIAAVGGAVLAGVAGGASLALQLTGDNPVERIAPLGELADRANSGIERIDRTTERFRQWGNEVTGYSCRVELRTSREYEICTRRLGPFVTTKTIDPDGNITREIRMNTR